MTTETIVCPQCNARIPLGTALAGQVEEQVRQQVAIATHQHEQELAAAFEAKLVAERETAAARARKDAETEQQNLAAQVAEKDAALAQAREVELALRKQHRALEEKQKNVELDVARRVDEQAKAIEAAAAERAAEQHRIKDLEKEQQLASLKRTIEDLQRKVDQGSQQTQGEAVEVELETVLASAFPHDLVTPVSKGVRGADITQKVHTPAGADCGTIVWESKNAKNWTEGWIGKLKEDQRAQKAELAVLLTTALPEGVTHFGQRDGVWVCDLGSALGLATALRSQLIELQRVRAAAEGKAGKSEMLYAYLSGTDFRQRIEAIAEAFEAMHAELRQERTAMNKIWAKREKQIGTMSLNVAGLYGDVQGIVGASLPELRQLQLPEGDGDGE